MSELAQGLVKKTSAYLADPTAIKRREGWNVRFDFGEIEELANSIAANGFYANEPILVKRNSAGVLEIVDGDRRLTAVELLIQRGQWKEVGVPVVIADRQMDDAEGYIRMFTANTGKNFLPLEEAAAYKRLADLGIKPVEIARRIGRSEAHVADRLSLLGAAPEVKEALKNGKLGSTLAENIAKKKDQKEQAELVKKATESKAGKKEVQEKVTRSKKAENFLAPSAVLAQIEVISELVKKLGEEMGVAEPSMGFASKSDDLNLAYQIGYLDALKKVAGKA